MIRSLGNSARFTALALCTCACSSGAIDPRGAADAGSDAGAPSCDDGLVDVRVIFRDTLVGRPLVVVQNGMTLFAGMLAPPASSGGTILTSAVLRDANTSFTIDAGAGVSPRTVVLQQPGPVLPGSTSATSTVTTIDQRTRAITLTAGLDDGAVHVSIDREMGPAPPWAAGADAGAGSALERSLPERRKQFEALRAARDRTRAEEAAADAPRREALLAALAPGDLSGQRSFSTSAELVLAAARRGELGALERMAARDPSIVTLANGLESTALHDAAEGGQVEAARWLIAHGADVNIDARGTTPLHGAVSGGHVLLARLLLEHGAQPDRADVRDTPLSAAVKARDPQMVGLLLDAGADPNFGTNQECCVAIFAAVYTGDLAILKLLVARGGNLQQAQSARPPLLLTAAGAPQAETLLRWLLDQGVLPDESDLDGAVPRSRAALQARLIRIAQAEESAEEAAAMGHLERLRRALNDRRVVMLEGAALLARAAEGGQVAAFDLLMQRGAKPQLDDGDMLSAAASGGHTAMVRRLLRAGARFGDDGGASLLVTAAAKGRTDLVTVLLDAGVPIDAMDGYHRTALEAARREGRDDVVALLERVPPKRDGGRP